MRFVRCLPFVMLPVIAACSDLRATYEIDGSAHSLTLIRVTGMPWEKQARYAVVAARLPACQRRHALAEADSGAPVEVFAPGNDAWILRQGGRLYVVETRTCEGFARLDKEPETGLGEFVGTFEMRKDALVFVPARPTGDHR